MGGIRDLTAEMYARKRAKKRKAERGCDHDWVPAGRRLEKCRKCGDQFPCKKCTHLDCLFERQEPLEEGVVVLDEESEIAWDGYNYVEFEGFDKDGLPILGLEID